jgi:hypothetical protein
VLRSTSARIRLYYRRHLLLKSETGYSANPCSTVRHSKSSTILANSVAQIPSYSIISGSTAVFANLDIDLPASKDGLHHALESPTMPRGKQRLRAAPDAWT